MAAQSNIASNAEAHAAPINPGVRIGHVHLKVADIDRALNFYCGVLGFELTQRIGPQAAFISAGGYHHHIGLNTWESRGGPPPPAGIDRPLSSRDPLSDARRARRRAAPLIEAKIPLEGASDHGVSEALYLRDPDDNGVELYWDRPKEAWPFTADGKLAMFTRRLDLTNLLAENDKPTAAKVDAPLFEPSRNS